MKEIKKDVYWVGKVDWELRKFHGDEYSTHRGTTYNSYLVKEYLYLFSFQTKKHGHN